MGDLMLLQKDDWLPEVMNRAISKNQGILLSAQTQCSNLNVEA